VFHHNRTLGPFLQSIGSVAPVVVGRAYEVFNALYRLRDGHPLGVSAGFQHGQEFIHNKLHALRSP
jgi:hypothetical protein